jgi:predicted molibdopterin-dependent oxidoreductase YjgC
MGRPMPYENAEAIMKEIARVTPSYCGITYDRLSGDGLHWPCTGTDHPGTPCLHVDRFTCGLGVFHALEYQPPAELPDEDYPLYLTTGRVLYQFHTGTMTMRTGGLNELAPACFVEISGEDARRYGLKDGDALHIASRRGEIEARTTISDQAVEGTVFIPFHYAKAAVNRLTNNVFDPTAGIPEYKVCAVRIEKR